jgi:hypothetical protein
MIISFVIHKLLSSLVVAGVWYLEAGVASHQRPATSHG